MFFKEASGRRRAGLAAGLSVLWAAGAAAQESGSAAVVVYNSRKSESRKVAEHYAERRGVPASQIIGLDLPESETMSRIEYDEELRKPLLDFLRGRGLMTFSAAPNVVTNSFGGRMEHAVSASKIRYAVLCYGVPLTIQRDSTLVEPAVGKLPPEVAPRNEAAVDSELALLPSSINHYPLSGPIYNTFYATSNSASISPTNGVLIVARLDGPSFAIANALVDKALEAEERGLWGRAYFDARGLASGEYKPGDDSILGAAQVCRQSGFETIVDNRAETFPASFPMSQIAFYAGWYDANVSGPFTLRTVEFMPGAVAYHLHSLNAHSIRVTNQYWVGPLLAKGVTATLGSVEEPYLSGTPDMAVFFSRFVAGGFSFGEAGLASGNSLSWQTTLVGDPLYRPFAIAPKTRHEKLVRENSRLVEWSILRFADINLAAGAPVSDWIGFLERQPESKKSAVLMEKLGDLCEASGKPATAISYYESALKANPSPQQTIRLLLTLGSKFEAADRLKEAIGAYKQLFTRFPDYPDIGTIRFRLTALSTRLDAVPGGSR
jgi:uncharacterized protein (TIGR03790 family)